MSPGTAAAAVDDGGALPIFLLPPPPFPPSGFVRRIDQGSSSSSPTPSLLFVTAVDVDADGSIVFVLDVNGTGFDKGGEGRDVDSGEMRPVVGIMVFVVLLVLLPAVTTPPVPVPAARKPILVIAGPERGGEVEVDPVAAEAAVEPPPPPPSIFECLISVAALDLRAGGGKGAGAPFRRVDWLRPGCFISEPESELGSG